MFYPCSVLYPYFSLFFTLRYLCIDLQLFLYFFHELPWQNIPPDANGGFSSFELFDRCSNWNKKEELDRLEVVARRSSSSVLNIWLQSIHGFAIALVQWSSPMLFVQVGLPIYTRRQWERSSISVDGVSWLLLTTSTLPLLFVHLSYFGTQRIVFSDQ